MSRKFLVKNVSPFFALPFVDTSDVVRRAERRRQRVQFVKHKARNLGLFAVLPGSLERDGKSKKAQAQYVRKHIKEQKNKEQAPLVHVHAKKFEHSYARHVLQRAQSSTQPVQQRLRKDEKKQAALSQKTDNSLLLSLEQTQNMLAGFAFSSGHRRAGLTEKATGEFKSQLRERRKIRFIYGGLSRRHLQEAVRKAKLLPGSPNENLLSVLESRVDVALQRCGFFLSIQTARQSVLSRKIKINSKIVLSPSYLLKAGDIISVKSSAFRQTKTMAYEIVPAIKRFEKSFLSWNQQISPFAFSLFLKIQDALLRAIELELKSVAKASYTCAKEEHSLAEQTEQLRGGLNFVNTPNAEKALNTESFACLNTSTPRKGFSLQQIKEKFEQKLSALQQITKDCAFDSARNSNKFKYLDSLCLSANKASLVGYTHAKAQPSPNMRENFYKEQSLDLRKKALVTTAQSISAKVKHNLDPLVSAIIPSLTYTLLKKGEHDAHSKAACNRQLTHIAKNAHDHAQIVQRHTCVASDAHCKQCARAACATPHARFFNAFCFWLHIRKNLLTFERHSNKTQHESWILQKDHSLINHYATSYQAQHRHNNNNKTARAPTQQLHVPLKKMSKCLHLEVSYQSLCAIYLFPTQQTSLPFLLDLDLINRSL